MTDIINFAVGLSVLVLVHEFGHYFAAILTGVKVEEFGLGLPPRIWGKKVRGTVWSLNWLPIGGFCKLQGEMPGQALPAKYNKESSFANKNPWQKGLIVLGGVLMNLVTAIVIFTAVYSILGIPTETSKVKIVGVAKNSPAEMIGLEDGDWVQKINGDDISTPTGLTEKVAVLKGKKIKMLVEKNTSKEIKELEIEVRENPPAGEGAMGIAISNTEMVKMKWYELHKGVMAGFKEAYFWGKIIAEGVFKMIGGMATGHLPKDVSGPIGMFEATSSIKKNQGMLALVHFFGIVSVNLAIVNVLPFPALDGGRIIFVIYELITKKRANENFEATVNNLGMLLLLSMIVMITVGDVLRLIGK